MRYGYQSITIEEVKEEAEVLVRRLQGMLERPEVHMAESADYVKTLGVLLYLVEAMENGSCDLPDAGMLHTALRIINESLVVNAESEVEEQRIKWVAYLVKMGLDRMTV